MDWERSFEQSGVRNTGDTAAQWEASELVHAGTLPCLTQYMRAPDLLQFQSQYKPFSWQFFRTVLFNLL